MILWSIFCNSDLVAISSLGFSFFWKVLISPFTVKQNLVGYNKFCCNYFLSEPEIHDSMSSWYMEFFSEKSTINLICFPLADCHVPFFVLYFNNLSIICHGDGRLWSCVFEILVILGCPLSSPKFWKVLCYYPFHSGPNL